MKCKALKHKTLKDTWGMPYLTDDHFELYHTNIPLLQPETATLEDMRNEYAKDKDWDNTIILKQLDDYELVTIELDVFDEKLYHVKTYMTRSYDNVHTTISSDKESCFGHDRKMYAADIKRVDSWRVDNLWITKVYYLLHLNQ